MNRINRCDPQNLRQDLGHPASTTAAADSPVPYWRARGATTRAIAPVAAEIMAGRPPTIAIVTAIVNEENNPTRGSTRR